MKSIFLLFCFLLSFFSLSFSQEISDSLIVEKGTLSDSIATLLLSREDSLREFNEATINHIKKIFSNSPNKRPTIGLALAGGGAKGFAHSGVLQLIDSLDIPVDFIAGNSMGGLVAALYSIGYSGKDLEKYTKSLDWNVVLNDDTKREELPFIQKSKTGLYQLSVGLKGYQPTVPSGLIYGQNVQMEFLKLTAPYEGVENFDELPIPFRCVAVDLVTGKEEILKNGSLSKAMRSTMSIPSAFSPVDWDDLLLVDGMVLNNFPVDVVKEMGADIVIGLNLTTGRMEKEDLGDMFSILNRSTDIPTGGRLKENIELSDIYISQNLDGFSTADFASDRITQIIERGKEAGSRNMEVFLTLKEELEKYDQYQHWKNIEKSEQHREIAKRRENFISLPPTIANISIVGNEKFESDFIEEYLGIETGMPFQTEVIQKKIEALYALNYFETVSYEIIKIDDTKINLQINIREKNVNRIVAGIKYNDHFKLIGLFGLETNSVLIQGAQMEAYFRFGGLTLIDLTILYPSRSMDIPLYPFLKISYTDIPINFYLDGRKVFSFYDRSWDFAGGLNFSLSKYWNLEAFMNYEIMNVATDIASSDINSLVLLNNPDAKIAAAKFNLLFDTLDDIILPNSGLYFKAFAEITLKELNSEVNYKRIYGVADYFIPISNKHNIKLSASYAFAGEGTPFYKWFYVGGPDSFVGIDYFQANGTEFAIGQVNYRYEFVQDIFLGGTFNVMFGYNLGTYDSPIRGEPILGGGLSAIMRTMFGKVELMWARGDANMNDPGEKVSIIYFTFGYNLK